jgi:glycosyltransferase involved in cell wall biosynthesis
MKVAIVHDYLIQMGGAERVVDVLHTMFPDAPIFTTAQDSSKLLKGLQDADIRTSWMQKVPGVSTHFKNLLPLYPIAIRDLDFREYDVVISSSSAFAKGIKVPRSTFHLCYCHNPMRFAWDFHNYMKEDQSSNMVKALLKAYTVYLRHWDRRTSNGVNQYIANSSIVKQRIKQYYNREADIIFPPVDTSRFKLSTKVDDYFLIVSRLVSYKKIDLAIQAFNKLGLPLYIVGEGPDRGRLNQMSNANIHFLGRLEDEEVGELMSRCKAFIFPGEEDFGITPLEVNAAGRPVIAYQAGGALDTIVPYTNGLFFERQEVDQLISAIREAESYDWNTQTINVYAKKFDIDTFKGKFTDYFEKSYYQFVTEKEQKAAYGVII